MTHVERFRALMDFRQVDRLPAIEWAGYWDKTLDRWHWEGLPVDLTNPAAVREFLGLDPYRQCWMRMISGTAPKPEFHGAGIIRDEAGYEAVLEHLYPDPPFDPAACEGWREKHERGDLVVWISLDGFFWGPRSLFGIERHFYAFYDQPELMHRINHDIAEFHLRCIEWFCDEVCVPEFMTFAEDMSYNNGPMLSKDLFDEFLAPYYGKVVPVLKERGILPMVDSDGDVTALIPWLEEVGIEGLLPYEKMAGCDVAGIREEHPRWRMIGAFDKMVMKEGEEAMRAEFERLLPVMRTEGFIASVDHQTPPDVSLEMYRLYLRLLKEYCVEAAEG